MGAILVCWGLIIDKRTKKGEGCFKILGDYKILKVPLANFELDMKRKKPSCFKW